MTDIMRLKNNLMWRGWTELSARRLSEEISINLDNYAKAYDYHTESRPTQTDGGQHG